MKARQREALRRHRAEQNREGRKANARSLGSHKLALTVREPEVIFTKPVVIVRPEPEPEVVQMLRFFRRVWSLWE